MLKSIFKITPWRVANILIIFLFLYFSHFWCTPHAWVGGAIMPNGEVGGGLETKCGFFSQWIWDNSTIYSLYGNIKGYQILIFSIIVVLIFNWIVEVVKKKKNLTNTYDNKIFKILRVFNILIIILLILIFLLFFL